MPRNMGVAMASGLAAKSALPLLLVDLTLNSDVVHVWSGVGSFAVGGNSYTGVGDLGTVTIPEEGVDVNAGGATLELSGVNHEYLQDALSDISLGAAAAIRLGLWNKQTSSLGDTPVVLFAGIVDAPSISTGAEQGSDGEPGRGMISVPIESRLAILGAGQQRKYSRADQAIDHPNDSGFDWQSLLNYRALKWGS